MEKEDEKVAELKRQKQEGHVRTSSGHNAEGNPSWTVYSYSLFSIKATTKVYIETVLSNCACKMDDPRWRVIHFLPASVLVLVVVVSAVLTDLGDVLRVVHDAIGFVLSIEIKLKGQNKEEDVNWGIGGIGRTQGPEVKENFQKTIISIIFQIFSFQTPKTFDRVKIYAIEYSGASAIIQWSITEQLFDKTAFAEL